MTEKKYILDTEETRPRHPWYAGRYIRTKLDRVDTSAWRKRKRQEKREGEKDVKKTKMRQIRGFKFVAGQIRTGNKLTYGIIATLKGRLLVKCDLPQELQIEVNTILDWSLPYERKPSLVKAKPSKQNHLVLNIELLGKPQKEIECGFCTQKPS